MWSMSYIQVFAFQLYHHKFVEFTSALSGGGFLWKQDKFGIYSSVPVICDAKTYFSAIIPRLQHCVKIVTGVQQLIDHLPRTNIMNCQ